MPTPVQIRRALEVFADGNGRIDELLLRAVLVHNYGKEGSDSTALSESDAGRAVNRLTAGEVLSVEHGRTISIDEISATWASNPGACINLQYIKCL